MNHDDVFFILGSVRSGTTLLRDLLKIHPNLICPEETHFFRWAEPFASDDYKRTNKSADTLITHRQMDGVQQCDFERIIDLSLDRKDFMLNYLSLFKKAQQDTDKKNATRFFDKTPQNVYGLPLIRGYFPQAKIIHIVRNPLNVVTSLKLGRMFSPQSLTSSINHWKESIMIINTMKPLLGDDLYEFRYEDLTRYTEYTMTDVLEFLDEASVDMSQYLDQVKPAQNNYLKVLNQSEIDTVCDQLGDWMAHYGYVRD